MNLDRIERALRGGPVDEPRYVPGGYGRPRHLDRSLLAAVVAASLVVGLVIGVGLDLLRDPSPDLGPAGPDPSVVQAQLAGSWISEPVTEEEFVAFMLGRGHAQVDVDAWLGHDPMESTVRWGLDFDGRGSLAVFSITGDGITDVLANGPYELLADGRLRWTDRSCVLSAEFSASAEQLTFGRLALENCTADERIAHETFFALASPYELSVR